MTEFASGKTEHVSIEQTDLLVREVKARKQTITQYVVVGRIWRESVNVSQILINKQTNTK